MAELFETAVVGSMPRPKYMQDLLNTELNRGLTEEEYRAKVDTAISFIIHLQEKSGIDIISDGEWRRLSYIGVTADFPNGFERTLKDGLGWHTITKKISYRKKSLFADESRFLFERTSKKTKVAIPSPFLIGARMWDKERSQAAYKTREEFMRDMVPYLRQAVRDLNESGVSSIQIDDPNLCLFVDPEYRKKFENPVKECQLAVELINEITGGSGGVEIGIHLCRSTGTRNRVLSNNPVKGFVGKGSYDFILPYLKELKVDQFVLEFAHPDAGDFSILEELPAKSKIGLGCVDVRAGVMDSAEAIAKRVEEALQHVDKERISLNPDCGFAPGNQANVSLDDAYLKLQEMAKAASMLREKYG